MVAQSRPNELGLGSQKLESPSGLQPTDVEPDFIVQSAWVLFMCSNSTAVSKTRVSHVLSLGRGYGTFGANAEC